VPHDASSKQLTEVAAMLRTVRERFDRLEARVADDEWHRRPALAAWSVAECAAHLNLTSAAMLPRLRAALDEARTLRPVGERAYAGALFGRVLAAMVGPVPIVLGLKLGKSKTAATFVPASGLPRAGVVAEYHRWHDEWARLVAGATGLAIDEVTVESPFVAGARYDGYSALRIVAQHELRHVVQAERALTQLRQR